MFIKPNALVVGTCSIVSQRITKVRGYEEAIELLDDMTRHFNIVITDAKLPGPRSGHDVLSFIKAKSIPTPDVWVCHNETSHTLQDGTCWWIERSLLNFPFAKFHQATIDDYLRTVEQLKKCA